MRRRRLLAVVLTVIFVLSHLLVTALINSDVLVDGGSVGAA